MTYRPPPQQPNQFGMGIPPIMQYTIDASNNWQASLAGQDPNQVADSIVQYYSSAIDHFISARRQNHRLGVISQNRSQATAPGIGVDMIQSRGMETIRITVYPEYAPVAALPYLIDTNLDGYIAFVYNNLSSPSTTIQLLLNGQVVVDNLVVPADSQTRMILLAFGPTALRAQSLNDKTNPVLANSPSFQCNPPLGNTTPMPPNVTTGAYGPPNPIPAHKKLLTYFWANDFEDLLNPLNNVVVPTGGDTEPYTGLIPQFFASIGAPTPIPNQPVLQKIYYWSDPSKSPINTAGKNQFSMAGLPNTDLPAPTISVSIAEFFDRSKYRPANSSWKYPAGPLVIVNDTPLFWDSFGVFSDVPLPLFMDFDLTASNTTHADADTPGNSAKNNFVSFPAEKAKLPAPGGSGPPQVFSDFASFAQA